MIRDIRHLLNALKTANSHVYREANSSTDKMAGLRNLDTIFMDLSQLPPEVRKALRSDRE